MNPTSIIINGDYPGIQPCNFDGSPDDGWVEDGSCIHPPGLTTCYLDDDGDNNAYESRTIDLGCLADTFSTCVSHSSNQEPIVNTEPAVNYFSIQCTQNRFPHILCNEAGDIIYITTFHDIQYEGRFGCTDGSITSNVQTEDGEIIVDGINADVYGFCRDGTAANNDNECYTANNEPNGYFQCNYDPFADIDENEDGESFCVSDVGCGCGEFGGISPACPDNYNEQFVGTGFGDLPPTRFKQGYTTFALLKEINPENSSDYNTFFNNIFYTAVDDGFGGEEPGEPIDLDDIMPGQLFIGKFVEGFLYGGTGTSPNLMWNKFASGGSWTGPPIEFKSGDGLYVLSTNPANQGFISFNED